MKPSLRWIIVESRIGAIAIAALVVESCVWLLELLWSPTSRGMQYWYRYRSESLPLRDLLSHFGGGFGLQPMTLFIGEAIINFAAAWILSRSIYGLGPLQTLVGQRATMRAKSA